MRHSFVYLLQAYTVALNPDGTTVLWKGSKVWGLGVWRCNYVHWQGERRCTELKLLDKIDEELRKVVPGLLPDFWQKDCAELVELSAYQSTPAGVSIR